MLFVFDLGLFVTVDYEQWAKAEASIYSFYSREMEQPFFNNKHRWL